MKKRIGDYMMDEMIGSGAFGEVYRSSKSGSDEFFAIKMINKGKVSSKLKSYLDREIEILQKLNNLHIIKLIDLKVSEHNYYLIFEYCNGGDLLGYMKNNGGKLSEPRAREILSQIVDGLTTVYSMGGIHRDIKLANILLHYPTNEAREKDQPISKICDFGFAKMVENSNDVPIEMSIVGTPMNMSPEMMNHRAYTIESDIWSLGTIAYELLCGGPVFSAINKVHLTSLMEGGIYKIPKSSKLSAEAIDFLTSCLQYDQGKRLKWADVSKHPFICSKNKTPFNFEDFKKDNSKVAEDSQSYTFSSKVKYNFSNLYKRYQELQSAKLREEELEKERLHKLELEKIEKQKQMEDQQMNEKLEQERLAQEKLKELDEEIIRQQRFEEEKLKEIDNNKTVENKRINKEKPDGDYTNELNTDYESEVLVENGYVLL